MVAEHRRQREGEKALHVPTGGCCGRHLDRPVYSIAAGDDEAEQLLKERIHARLLDPARSEYDPLTECVVFLGAWNEKGQGIIRVGAKPHPVSRVAAWLYVEGFELWGENTAVRTCDTPACFNHEHLKIFPDRASAWRYLLSVGKVGNRALWKPPGTAA